MRFEELENDLLVHHHVFHQDHDAEGAAPDVSQHAVPVRQQGAGFQRGGVRGWPGQAGLVSRRLGNEGGVISDRPVAVEEGLRQRRGRPHLGRRRIGGCRAWSRIWR